MKRSIRVFILFAVAVCLAFAVAVPAMAWADLPTVAYDGSAHTLSLSGVEGDSDLFANFKNLMPGDVLTQEIDVRANNVNAPLRLFIKADVDERTSQDLADVTLQASYEDESGERSVETGSVGAVFAKGLQIASFRADGEGVLKLELSVPVSVGNELADASRQIVWHISAEDDGGEVSAAVSSDNVSQSGGLSGLVNTDDRTAVLVGGIVLLGVLFITGGIVTKHCN